ncbi:MAG: class II aldolase/adducin family protein, partial [Bacteroidales bacterium]|nr:class II aldolase/adducin family protein [Bacteroidales bacterium]
MEEQLKDLIEISRFYGADNEFVIAGGGNTSFKNDNTLWVKASGEPLAQLTLEGLVALDRNKLRKISSATYSDDSFRREEEVKNDLNAAIIDPSKNKRPSVETSLHEMIRYNFVVHLHPTLINGVLCSRNAKNLSVKFFGDTALFVPYTDPGYILFKKLENEIEGYRSKSGRDPQIILLENHGVFVAADTTAEIKKIYDNIFAAVEKEVPGINDIEELPYNPVMNMVLPALRMMLSEDKPKVIRYRHNSLIAKYYQGQKEFNNIAHPLIPDTIVYCKTRYLFIEQSSSPERLLDSLRTQLPRFKNEYGYLPK